MKSQTYKNVHFCHSSDKRLPYENGITINERFRVKVAL